MRRNHLYRSQGISHNIDICIGFRDFLKEVYRQCGRILQQWLEQFWIERSYVFVVFD